MAAPSLAAEPMAEVSSVTAPMVTDCTQVSSVNDCAQLSRVTRVDGVARAVGEMVSVEGGLQVVDAGPDGGSQMVSVDGIDGCSQLVNVEGSVSSHGEI